MLLEICSLQLAVEEQDLKDRRKMALVGAKDKKLRIQELHGSTLERVPKSPDEGASKSTTAAVIPNVRSTSNESQKQGSQSQVSKRGSVNV